ncbi:MAG: pectate lyase [Bacteroidales bacterium]|nr:pectate lyase [Bacteroidales bacterium]
MQHLTIVYRIFLLLVLCFLPFTDFFAQSQETIPVYIDKEGRLAYTPDSLDNRIPDYSFCGYKAGNHEIPMIPVKVVVPVQGEDATKTIQEAINYVSLLPQDEHGFRGAVLLEKGIYRLEGRLVISASGVALRGSGMDVDGTVLIADGKNRETLIRIAGMNNLKKNTEATIIDSYVPVGTNKITVGNNHTFKAGDPVRVHRPVTWAWINTLGMESFGGESGWLRWKPRESGIVWERTITATDEHSVTLDAPLTTALDAAFGGGFISTYSWEGRISDIGIENIRCRSSYNTENLKDEDHCWMAVTIENAKDCWVRQVTFEHFAGSAVAVYETAKQVTIEDCISLSPVSEIGGQRRYTFFTSGQLTLFQRCYAENGYHDFATGNFAPGPNAFVQCESHLPNNFSGTTDRWASGVLFDLVYVDGNALSLGNRGPDGQGAGWTAANSMIWQCSAARIDCYSPPTATNWAFGAWGQFSGNGSWHESNSHIKPRSLYYAQLAERTGDDMLKRAHFLPVEFESTSSPSVDQAQAMTASSANPQIHLRAWIEHASQRTPVLIKKEAAIPVSRIMKKKDVENETIKKEISIENGWLIIHDAVLTGRTIGTQWWRGTIRPEDVEKSGPHLTRFVPGRTGMGFTDNLEEVTNEMICNNILAIDHNYGLWYERRRDDHERIRRMDSDVWPPFYEQPFARSGQDIAWDGLSKYDLTKPNHWYWMRLKQFAGLADKKGLVLIHQHYFQHNMLEAGAHWADFPWRTVNNINNTGFPEPPPYAGDKCIFMAEQFYDVTHPERKKIHKQYIRQCLNNFADNANVVHLIGKEYTGPLHFVEFWIDNIKEWEKETSHNALIGLSTTKDVQDTILADPLRSPSIEIIDIRYWQYRADGSLYAPEGGKNLAPRQHARLVNPGKASFQSVYKAVSEYRIKFPEKAVIYSNPIKHNLHWAVFMAGGSMAAIPVIDDKVFYVAAATMKPVTFIENHQEVYSLANAQGEKIMYCSGESIPDLELPGPGKEIELIWIDPANGQILKTEGNIKGGRTYKPESPIAGDVVLWIKKK